MEHSDAQGGLDLLNTDALSSASPGVELANAKARIDELEAKVERLQSERDNWIHQADENQRLLLDARANLRPAGGISTIEFLINLVAMLAFLAAVAVTSILNV